MLNTAKQAKLFFNRQYLVYKHMQTTLFLKISYLVYKNAPAKLFLSMLIMLNFIGCVNNFARRSFHAISSEKTKLHSLEAIQPGSQKEHKFKTLATIQTNSPKKTEFKPLSSIQEYVSRIGKRLLIVNLSPNIRSMQCTFTVNNQTAPTLILKPASNSSGKSIANITISKGLLDYLGDEAELAAIIAISLDLLKYADFTENNYQHNLNADLRIIEHLARADYDPNSFVELQKEYLKTRMLDRNWLNCIFANTNINHYRIKHNTATISKMPKNLQRNKESFLSNIYLL